MFVSHKLLELILDINICVTELKCMNLGSNHTQFHMELFKTNKFNNFLSTVVYKYMG